MKRVLVTGGAGYIGSHTCKLLARSGYEPITYDNLSTGHESFVKWGPLVVGDLLETDKLARAIRQYEPVGVIHFAASTCVSESVADPFKYYKNNVGGTLSLLEAMRVGRVHNIVFSSTCAIYGIPQARLLDEQAPQNPINPYGLTKLMIEQMMRDLSARDELGFVALRYFNAAGADREQEIGEWHEPETHLIPLAIRSAFGGAGLRVFGTDFDTPDGTPVRDYIHVEDLARAHLSALEYLATGGESDVINLGTGTGSSVHEVISSLAGLGVPVKFENVGRRDGDSGYLVADSRKAKRVLNWAPAWDLSGILKTAVDWHRHQDR